MSPRERLQRAVRQVWPEEAGTRRGPTMTEAIDVLDVLCDEIALRVVERRR